MKQAPIAIRLLSYFVDFIEVVLGLRFLLRLGNANAENGFVRFLYDLSGVFLAPFRGIFPESTVEGTVFEWSTLFAMAIYWLAGYLIARLILLLMRREEERVREESRKDEEES